MTFMVDVYIALHFAASINQSLSGLTFDMTCIGISRHSC